MKENPNKLNERKPNKQNERKPNYLKEREARWSRRKGIKGERSNEWMQRAKKAQGRRQQMRETDRNRTSECVSVSVSMLEQRMRRVEGWVARRWTALPPLLLLPPLGHTCMQARFSQQTTNKQHLSQQWSKKEWSKKHFPVATRQNFQHAKFIGGHRGGWPPPPGPPQPPGGGPTPARRPKHIGAKNCNRKNTLHSNLHYLFWTPENHNAKFLCKNALKVKFTLSLFDPRRTSLNL